MKLIETLDDWKKTMAKEIKNEEWVLNDFNSWERNPLFKGQQTPPPIEEAFDGAMVSEDWDVI